MPAVFLAAYAVCGVNLFLQPQEHLRDVRWPSHAVIALPQGWAKSTDQLFVLENGQPIVAQVESAAKWPDGSPKWLHAYASFRYIDGKPAKYELEKRAKLPDQIPKSPLTVSDTPAGIEIDTGLIKLRVPRPFAGVTSVEFGGQKLLSGPGGPSLVDERGIVWQAVHDQDAEIVVEQQGPAQVTVKATGWYQTAERRVTPFCRFTTRITACANSAVLMFDHATVFADDMRKHAISELAFNFSLPEVKGYSSQLHRGDFGEKLTAVSFAQLSPEQWFLLTEQASSTGIPPKTDTVKERSAGWFSANLADRRVVMLTKDFWQKCPKEVSIRPDGLTYYAWPRHNELARQPKSATELANVYKFLCFHTGKLLDSRLPSEYFTALQTQTDTTECKAEYARAANLEGVAMHNEFALMFLAGSPPDGTGSEDGTVGQIQKLYAQHPIARVSPEAIVASGVLGPVAARGRNFPEIDRAVRDGMLGYAHSIERYGDYGWAIYGNVHSEEFMNPAAAGLAGGRPSLHRVWNNNHYQHVSTSWQLYALHGDPRLLDWARICTDNYASIGQVRYDAGRGRIDGYLKQHPGPGVKYHNPGAFWHCKALVPWGGRDYGMDSNDDDSGLTGHWPDPSGLLYAWFYDANRWAKDGYELWRAHVKFPTGGSRREINTTLVHAITAYEYQPDAKTLEAIQGMARGLMSVPIMQQRPGPIWEPTWLSRYHELFPNDETFNKYVVASADAVGIGVEAVWSLALSATAYRITKNDDYLRRHAGTLARAVRQVFYDASPDKRWDKYGFGPGPDRDGHFMLQWARFNAALQEAKITSLPPPEEPGQYFTGVCRWDNSNDIKARGTEILIWNEQGGDFKLDLQAIPLGGGDIGATSLQVHSPGGQSVLSIPRIPMSGVVPVVNRIMRPSTWSVATETHPVSGGKAGLYSFVLGGDAGLFRNAPQLPECQVLRRKKLTTWYEDQLFLVKLTHGYLVPLTTGRIQLEFVAMGVADPSTVSLSDMHGKQFFSRQIRAGDTATVTLNDSPGTTGPWLLDVFSDHTGYVRMTIAADVDRPLLFGSRLEDIQLIREKLAK